MRPFQPPRPNRNQPHRARPGGDPGPPFPAVPMHSSFPPQVPNHPAAANPMAAAAAANPFLALQLLGQAQQLQNLGFLAAAAFQQQQQQPFFPGGFPPNPNQFAPFPGPHAGFNGGGAFQPGGASFCGPQPPRPMINPVGKGCNNTGGAPPGPRPMLNAGLKNRNSNGGSNVKVNRSENTNGTSDFSSESGGMNKVSDQKGRFNAGRDRGMTDNLVLLGGGEEEGTPIKVVEEETITGERQTPSSRAMKVPHLGAAITFQLQHREDTESVRL